MFVEQVIQLGWETDLVDSACWKEWGQYLSKRYQCDVYQKLKGVLSDKAQ